VPRRLPGPLLAGRMTASRARPPPLTPPALLQLTREIRRADPADAERQRQFEAATALCARVDELTWTVIERTERAAEEK
jgi:hypothetical protein